MIPEDIRATINRILDLCTGIEALDAADYGNCRTSRMTLTKAIRSEAEALIEALEEQEPPTGLTPDTKKCGG